MAGRITDYQAHAWLKGMSTLWLSLHHENPEIGGAYASEITGGGYARKQTKFNSPNARAIFSAGVVKWDGLPALTVSYIGAWDARYNGNLLAFFELESPTFITAGGSVAYAAGEIAISLD